MKRLTSRRLLAVAVTLCLVLAVMPFVLANYPDSLPATTDDAVQVEPSESSDVSVPDTSVPDVSTPDVSTPDTSVPDVSSPDTSVPDVSTPDTSVPDVSTPDTSVPDVSTPDTSVPDVSSPDTSAPDVSAPDVPPMTPALPDESVTTGDGAQANMLPAANSQIMIVTIHAGDDLSYPAFKNLISNKLGTRSWYGLSQVVVSYMPDVTVTSLDMANFLEFYDQEGQPGPILSLDSLPDLTTLTNSHPSESRITQLMLPNSLKTIGDHAFEDCVAMGNFNIPGGVTSVGADAFKGCTNLRSTGLANHGELQSVGANAFAGCTNLAEASFAGCGKLSSLADSVFANCTALKKISLAGCKSLASLGSAIASQSALTEIDLSGSGLTSVTPT